MPRFLLDFSPDFATGRLIPLPFDIPVEQWPTLDLVAPPVIESADGYTDDSGAGRTACSIWLPGAPI